MVTSSPARTFRGTRKRHLDDVHLFADAKMTTMTQKFSRCATLLPFAAGFVVITFLLIYSGPADAGVEHSTGPGLWHSDDGGGIPPGGTPGFEECNSEVDCQDLIQRLFTACQGPVGCANYLWHLEDCNPIECTKDVEFVLDSGGPQSLTFFAQVCTNPAGGYESCEHPPENSISAPFCASVCNPCATTIPSNCKAGAGISSLSRFVQLLPR